LSFPKIRSGLGSPREAETLHHPGRPDLISGRNNFTHPSGRQLLGSLGWRLPADAKRVQIPATGKFKSSHKRLNPASTGLGVLVSFNPLWPLLNL
jgi:hypothetical protein